MKVYRSFEALPAIKNAVVTQGTFDGVHAAHNAILNRLKEIAVRVSGETVVMTFDPHPRLLLYPEATDLKLLQTLDEKIVALEENGIDHLLIIPFTKEFSEQSSLQFIRNVLVNKLKTKVLVIGYNHRFGKNREGSFEHLSHYGSQHGFEVIEIPQQDVESVSVSSTRIRAALGEGDIVSANKYLGRPYSLFGVVQHGKQLGRMIGFPTANIFVSDKNKLIPSNGVYAVWATVKGKKYGGMLNSGVRPTVDGKNFMIEVHIFNFNDDIYNEAITIEYVDKLRNEILFHHINELKNQLQKDKLHATEILSANK